MLVVLVSASSASKEVVDWFGTASGNGSLGGEFNQPRDVALNSTGAGGVPAGTIYVADDANHRIQRFAPDGSFVEAWGANVLTAPVNEAQTVTVNATAGTFTLSFAGATTAPLAYDATSAQVQTALRALSTVGGANLSVSGTAPYTVTFNTTLQATNTPQLSADDSLLTGSIAVATTTQGSGKYEICTVASECTAGTQTGAANAGNTDKNGSLDNPQSVAVDNDTGDVYVSDRDNRRVNVYTATGTFVRSFGWGVDATTPGDEYEVCPAANRCRFGIAGAGTGQIGSIATAGVMGVAVSPANGEAAIGKVFLADTQNRRVNTYNLDGTSPSSFGTTTNFATGNPRRVAVDSRGIVYASDSGGANRINRYDSENANGGGTVFLAPIASPPLLAGPASTATSGLAVDPDSDGAGPDEDVLYVLRDPTSGNTVVQQFGPTNDPGLTAAPTAVDDTHGNGAGFATVLGLGLNNANGKLYVSATTDVSGTGAGHRVYVLDNAPAPAVTLDPVTTFDAHSAVFTGEVNPNGTRTGYHFEYVDDAEFNLNGFTNAARFPFTDANIGSGTSAVDVEIESPHHLVPGTTYHVRLLAKQTFTATQTIGGPQTFTTPGSAPSFHTAATAGEEEATLRAAINPENQEVTNYHFQWGPTDAYGNSTPAGTLASGNEPVAVEEALTGLTPGVEYHYRLVATNGTGTTVGSDRSFTASTPPQFPERAYELVSHYPTESIPPTGVKSVSEDGDSVQLETFQPFPNTQLIPILDFQHLPWRYQSDRTANGWNLNPTGVGQDLIPPSGTSADGSRQTFGVEAGLTDERLDPDDGTLGIGNPNSREVYQRRPDGTLVWVSRDPRIPVGTVQTSHGAAEMAGGTAPAVASMSVDGRTVLFGTQEQLLDEDTTPTGQNTVRRLYKWDDGALSFIGKRPDGSVPALGSDLGTAIPGLAGRFRLVSAVSRNGNRVVFSANRRNVAMAEEGNAIYLHTDGESPVEVTKETGVPPLPAGQPYYTIFGGASADASRVFFTSGSRFTPDSGATRLGTLEFQYDLYVYDLAADKVRDLTPRLDRLDDPTADPAPGDRARVLGVPAWSEDGRRVYFVAEAQYDVAPNPEGELPSPEGRNLYLAELDGIEDQVQLSFVAPLGPGDGAVWQPVLQGKTVHASPDGSVFSFGSSEPLTGQGLGGTQQLFVYDAEAHTLACASCPPDGSLPTGNVNTGSEFQQWQTEYYLRRWVASDGAVYFYTASPLVEEDQNVSVDVYEYRSGERRLLSGGGLINGASELESISRDGGSVFFKTPHALLPWDEEPGVPKIYAARVGGGLPGPPRPETTICDLGAGACEGPGTHAPDAPGAGTAAFQGPGDPQPKKAKQRCPKSKRKVRRHGKTRCVSRNVRKQGQQRSAKNDRRAGR